MPSPPPALLQVLPALRSGGVERGTLEIAEAQIAAGFRAIVASAGGEMVPALEALGAKHITLPLTAKSPWAIWRNAGDLAALAPPGFAVEDHDLILYGRCKECVPRGAAKTSRRVAAHAQRTPRERPNKPSSTGLRSESGRS